MSICILFLFVNIFRYSLFEDGSGQFLVDPASGLVSTAAILDREAQEDYHLVVMATDEGLMSHSAQVTLNVHIQDLNDNSPRFLQRSYTVFIREPTDQGTIPYTSNNYYRSYQF